VESVALTRGQGHVWGDGGDIPARPPSQPPPDPKHPATISFQEISPRFFETLRIGLVQGREFEERDLPGSPRVMIVNESLALHAWPHGPALDQIMLLNEKPYRVVGVVKDSILRSLNEGVLPMLFIPFWQNNTVPQVDARMAIRVKGDPEPALAAIKHAIAEVDPEVPVTELMPMLDQVRGQYSDVRVASAVLTSSAALALLLAALGLYGVISFTAARRTREVGIRMALGARPGEVIAMFLKQGVALLAVGGVAGLVLALASTRMLGAWLYGISSFDPFAFVAALTALIATTLLASWIPARRAARVDPMKALRVE
jgi:predicted permease